MLASSALRHRRRRRAPRPRAANRPRRGSSPPASAAEAAARTTTSWIRILRRRPLHHRHLVHRLALQDRARRGHRTRHRRRARQGARRRPSINAYGQVRRQKSDYDHWRRWAIAGLSRTRCCRCSSAVRTTSTVPTSWTAPGRAAVEGIRRAGDPGRLARRPPRTRHLEVREFNRGDNVGNADLQMNERRGVRWSATKAFRGRAGTRRTRKVLMQADVQAPAHRQPRRCHARGACAAPARGR